MNLKCPKIFALCSIQTAFHWPTLHRLTCCVQVVLDSFPAAVSGCWRWVKAPDKSAVHCRATQRDKQASALTPADNLELPVWLTRMCLDCGRTGKRTQWGHTNYSSTLTTIIEPIAVSFRKTSEVHLLSTFNPFLFRNQSFSSLVLRWRQRRKTRDRVRTHRIDSPLNSSPLGSLVLTVQRNVVTGTQLRKSVQGFCC